MDEILNLLIDDVRIQILLKKHNDWSKWCDQRYKELLNRSYEGFDLTFYGHSLDETDSDILVPFIKGAGKVRVYYYDEYDYEKKVINLINLFKRDYVEEKMYERKIEFVPAQ